MPRFRNPHNFVASESFRWLWRSEAQICSICGIPSESRWCIGLSADFRVWHEHLAGRLFFKVQDIFSNVKRCVWFIYTLIQRYRFVHSSTELYVFTSRIKYIFIYITCLLIHTLKCRVGICQELICHQMCEKCFI